MYVISLQALMIGLVIALSAEAQTTTPPVTQISTQLAPEGWKKSGDQPITGGLTTLRFEKVVDPKVKETKEVKVSVIQHADPAKAWEAAAAELDTLRSTKPAAFRMMRKLHEGREWIIVQSDIPWEPGTEISNDQILLQRGDLADALGKVVTWLEKPKDKKEVEKTAIPETKGPRPMP